MSILPPPHSEGPKPLFSTLDRSLNPTSEHGNTSPSSLSPSRMSSGIGSLSLAGSPSPSAYSGGSPDTMVSAGEDVPGSSKEVTRTETGKESFSPQNADRHDHSRSNGRRQRSRGRTPGAAGPSTAQNFTGPNNSPIIVSQHNLTGRRANMISGNHLLNFHYDPISVPRPRASPQPQRRQYKRRPYNKDLFLQANYKFVVLDTGDHSLESMDPDKMLQWEDIICVRYSTPCPVQCPICLEYPLCPQITSCGHIFCFPCILQYLLMGVDNHMVECFKRCPLCFMMVSPKDLYTIHIEHVKQYSVGDTIEFVLLTRKKESFAPTRKNENDLVFLNREDEICDPFSKFTFTTDVDLSVRQAVSELDGWMARADSGLVDDLERLPYVSAALGHLEQRKKYWNEHKLSSFGKPNGERRNQMQSVSGANVSQVGNRGSVWGHGTTSGSKDQNRSASSSPIDKSCGEFSLDKSGDDGHHTLEDQEAPLSSSYDGSKGLLMRQNGVRDPKDRDSYDFYQSVDGQHIILHSLNMKCLLQHYGSYDLLPPRVSGKILEMETVTQSEAMRRRYRFLSHFSLTTTFEICEIDMREFLPAVVFAPFMDEIKKREKQRKDRARKERKEKIKAEVAAAAELAPLVASFGQSTRNDFPPFSLDDFEALGNAAPVSSSPPNIGERSSFSNVTRMGFAAGHDSPGLKNEPTSIQNDRIEISNAAPGGRNPGIMSFASAISRTPEGTETNKEATGKRGKKPTRVLLSTTSVRRY